jgi:membrane protease YdiL (CAAX protease family)
MQEALRFVFLNDHGLRAGWRLAIFIALFAALSLVASLPLILLRSRPPTPTGGILTPGFQMVAEALTFLALLIATWIMSRIEKRPMGVYGLPLKGQPILRLLISGYVFWGFLALTVCLRALHLLGAYDFGRVMLHGNEILRWGTEWFLVFVLVGLTEEYLLRGYALYTLADGIGFWPATILLGVLFGLGHANNPNETQIGIIATVVFALFASVTLRLTGSLWLAVGAHAGWDWGQSFFYGVSDSGMKAQGHLLEPTIRDGPAWLTGGTVGPEGSIVTLILWCAMMLLFYLVYRNRKRPGVITMPAGEPPQQPV